MRRLVYETSLEDKTKTIKEYLKEKGFSAHLIRKIKKQKGLLLLDKESVFVNARLSAGQKIEVVLNEDETAKEKPVEMDLDILYEDEDILVVNKKAGMPTHQSQGNYENTLANGIAWHCQQKGETILFRAVNRLDKDTTGIVLAAKNVFSAGVLSKMGQDGNIKKEYFAICAGKVPERGMINAPIGRAEGSILERCIDFRQGEKAITFYERVHFYEKKKYSLVRLWLETGRTHQIRVHMRYLGHPIVGDFLYYPDFSLIQRQALHAYKIEFCHPVTGRRMEFSCPLPEDMDKITRQ